MVAGRVLLEFAVQVYREQLAAGRHFLHEHPASASSWAEPCMRRLSSAPGVHEVVGDQCRFGLLSPGEHGEPGPAKKPTRFLSSAGGMLRALRRNAKATMRTCSACRGVQLPRRWTRPACAGPSSAASWISAGARDETPSESRGRGPQAPASTRSRRALEVQRLSLAPARLSRAPACTFAAIRPGLKQTPW